MRNIAGEIDQKVRIHQCKRLKEYSWAQQQNPNALDQNAFMPQNQKDDALPHLQFSTWHATVYTLQ